MLDSKTLSEKAAELRAVAERMESLAKRQEELARESERLAREEEELTKWVGGGTSASEPQGDAGAASPPLIKPVPTKQVAPDLFQSEPKSQREWVLHLLGKHGPLTRDELMEKLLPSGKAPSNTEYLSAVLSALKKLGHLRLGTDFRWSLITPPADESP